MTLETLKNNDRNQEDFNENHIQHENNIQQEEIEVNEHTQDQTNVLNEISNSSN